VFSRLWMRDKCGPVAQLRSRLSDRNSGLSLVAQAWVFHSSRWVELSHWWRCPPAQPNSLSDGFGRRQQWADDPAESAQHGSRGATGPNFLRQRMIRRGVAPMTDDPVRRLLQPERVALT
jgi:hypothetical protein